VSEVEKKPRKKRESKSHVFLVTVGNQKRLIRAPHKNTAIRHIRPETVEARIPTPEELMQCGIEGIVIEDVKAMPPRPQPQKAGPL
jgi:hypothetical protein